MDGRWIITITIAISTLIILYIMPSHYHRCPAVIPSSTVPHGSTVITEEPSSRGEVDSTRIPDWVATLNEEMKHLRLEIAEWRTRPFNTSLPAPSTSTTSKPPTLTASPPIAASLSPNFDNQNNNGVYQSAATLDVGLPIGSEFANGPFTINQHKRYLSMTLSRRHFDVETNSPTD
jgi:hypothetical protein